MANAAENVFKYPGGKTRMAGWILSHFPDHECYVEVFGGSAAILANKPPSSVEVYNDRDGDLVHFFTTLRDHADELVAWLRDTPHSRQLHDEYAADFYNGVRPDDDVERAGRFFYLRETQFAAKYTSASGFNGSKKRNVASAIATKRERLRRWSDRFDHVQIERLDYADLFDRYDGPKTLFYGDPPYVDEGDDLYPGGDFDHGRFVNALAELEGRWIVSYTDLPRGLDELAEVVASKEQRYRMAQGQNGWEKTNTEQLVMNFDPETEPRFGGPNRSLGGFTE